MSETSINNSECSKDIFNILSFERKLVELVEELRWRRNLETENEKTLKSLMDEKYKSELTWDEEQRRYIREKEDLEQMIGLLKRKLDDKICVSDDDKAKQHVINRTYSHEIRMLKEELRNTKSEKLNFTKKIQELEGKLSLHNSFQENIVSQVAEVNKTVKSIFEESQELTSAQKNVIDNVASVKASLRKLDLCNQHLLQSIGIIGKTNGALKKDLIACRSEVTILRNSLSSEQDAAPKNNQEVENLQKKILELENLLLLSRKENEKTLHNFLESNKLLCKFMDKYSEIQDQERRLIREIDQSREKLRATERKLQDALDEIKTVEEAAALKEKQRIENRRSVEIQTEEIARKCSCSFNKEVMSNAMESISINNSKSDDGSFLEEMRQDLLGLQESSNFGHSELFQKGISVGSNKKLMISEVLKRKMEVSESGDKIELISMKKRIFENRLFDVSGGKMKDEPFHRRSTVEAESGNEANRKSEAINFPIDQKSLQESGEVLEEKSDDNGINLKV